MITGIYKITSPSNKVYVGQSIDIEKRWYKYKRMYCTLQPRLYRSFKKYGVDKHKFEIICQCSIEELNEMERFYQDAFCSTNENGLNCILTKTNDRNGEHTIETKIKIGISNKGRIVSAETRSKISATSKGKIISAETRAKLSASNKGKTASIETIKKISAASKLRTLSPKSRAKISLANTNPSAERRAKISYASKNISDETRAKIGLSRKKLVLHLLTGIYFDSAKDAALAFGCNVTTFRCMLNGSRTNKINCIYV